MTVRISGAMLLLAFAGSLAPLAGQGSARDIASRATPAVVTIRAFDGGDVTATGSGFIIDADGVVVTNQHVVEAADRLEVELSTGEVFADVYYLASNPDRDLVILKVPATQLPTLDIGDASVLAVGDPVYVVGNPMGMDRTFTDGLVSARRVLDGVGYIQISAPISPGSSGGPVLDASGYVVGVATASISEGQNLNLAVPIGYAEGLLSVAGDPRPFGQVAREWREVDATDGASADVLARAVAEAGDADRLRPWQQSVIDQLAEITSIVASEGFVPTDHGAANLLAADAAEAIELTLEPGTYKAIGVCDNDCDDLDLAVLSDDEEILGRDILTDAFPIVDFTVEETADFTVVTQMVDCSTETCFYGTIIYRQE